MKLIKFGSKQFEKVLGRDYGRSKRVIRSVAKILDDVRAEGDDAVFRYTRKFDRVKLTPRTLRVSESERSGAYQDIKPDFANALKIVLENIQKFYRRQMKKSWKLGGSDGVILGERITPLDTVGVYVPAGQVPLISTVYMTVIPAKMAGVRKIVLATPPNRQGYVDPHILVVADLLKVDEIYKMGGAQAIGAMAFGTKTVPRVDKIVGPGNAYVTEAKRQVFGQCGIDMLAGPTEVVIMANQFTNIDYLKADLEAQSEHAGGLSILVTTSRKLCRRMQAEPVSGYVVCARTIDEACEVVNAIAPEHLQILVNNPRNMLKKITNAGAIFLGPYTPVSLGDYVAGPSHVLPTGGTARFFSGLGVADFMKSSHIISYSKKALEAIREPMEKIAGVEGLQKHLDSVRVRFK